jgi:DNA-binding IclR family transcriptional regulator
MKSWRNSVVTKRKANDHDSEHHELQGVVKSAKRVLELFELFADQRRPLAVNDVVRHLDYPQSSASGLLKSLTKLGYLDYDRHARHYRPTLRVSLLGGWIHDELFSNASLQRMVDDLHATTGETVVIGMQNDIYLQYIHIRQKPPSETNRYYRLPGELRPLFRTACGRMLMSRKSDVEVLYLLRRANGEESDPAHRVNATDLLRELDSVRRHAFSYNEGTYADDAGMIAVQMVTPASQPPMAIGVGATLDILRPNRERYLELLRRALEPYRASRSGSS